ncbi:class I SAM-dependent methyltransferase [Nostoc sp. UHCC 0702]|nr:class I SAM-dependent methyltransferase [Nostoc sp. UHCC 0702]
MVSDNSNISQTVQSSYDDFYVSEKTAWRELGGKYKANNILSVCENHSFKKVLECGAGEGSILKFIDKNSNFTELYATEISESGISEIKKRNLPKLQEAKKFNGYEIPYPDKYFDMAYCSHVIEHVEHPRLLLRELKRVSSFQVFEIPLDYSVDVDKEYQHFLSYGHINIYTPSLFKFLLKSEGYEIIQELLTQSASEVERYNWYVNMKQKKSFIREFKLMIRPLTRNLKKLKWGEKCYNEYCFSAYTCLAKGSGELKIF